MASTSKQPSQALRIRNIEDRLRRLETRRSLGNASFEAGKLVVNPSGPGVRFAIETDTAYSPPVQAASIQLFSRDSNARPCTISMYDQGPGSVVLMSSNPDAAGYSASVSCAAGGGAQLQSGDVSFQVTGKPANGGPAIYIQPGGVSTWKWSGNVLQNMSQSVAWVSAASEWRAQDGSGGYVPVRAASFPTSSARGTKQNVTELPFNPAQVIKAAPAWQWEYKPDRASDTDRHVSPMADDLPDALVRGEGNDRTVDTRDLVGVLWAANRQLIERVERLEAAVKKLTGGAL